MDPLEQSIARTAARCAPNEPAIPSLVIRICQRAAVMWPFTVLCVTQMQADYFAPRGNTEVKVQALVQRGWDAASSLLMWRNFRFAHPTLRWPAEMMWTLPRATLIEEYGATFGHMLADAMSSESGQPYIRLLLSGSMVSERVVRPTQLAIFSCGLLDNRLSSHINVEAMDVDSMRFIGFVFNDGAMPDPDISNTRMLPVTTAANLYAEATGQAFDSTLSLNPLELDYEKLAQAEEEVRQADGDRPSTEP